MTARGRFTLVVLAGTVTGLMVAHAAPRLGVPGWYVAGALGAIYYALAWAEATKAANKANELPPGYFRLEAPDSMRSDLLNENFREFMDEAQADPDLVPFLTMIANEYPELTTDDGAAPPP